MFKNIWTTLIGISLSLTLINAHALIIDTSKNILVEPGALAYIGPGKTPHEEGGLNPRSIFTPTDPIRIAQSVSLEPKGDPQR